MVKDKSIHLEFSIMVTRFTREPGSGRYLEHIQTVDVSEQWITHLTWLPWASTGANERELRPRLRKLVSVDLIWDRRGYSCLLYF
jgi:hypothetical protein